MPFLAEDHYPLPTKDILSWYFDKPEYDLDQPVYVDAEDTSNHWTGRAARTAIRQLGAGFTTLGLKPGDCVCIHALNSIDYPIVVNGIVGFGGIFAGTNAAYQTYELVHHIKTSDAKAVLVEPELLDGFLAAAKELSFPRDRIIIFDHHGEAVPRGYKSWRTLMQHGERDWPRFNDKKIAASTIAARLFSSGTTGLPKAATLSHYNLTSQGTYIWGWQQRPWKTRNLLALPMFHAACVPTCHFNPLRHGEAQFIMRKFDLEAFLRNIERHEITELSVVPPMVVAMVMSPASKKYSLKSIKAGFCGAAPLDKGIQQRLQALLHPDASFTQVWGMTETSCVCSMTPVQGGKDSTGHVGRMLPGMDAKLVDDSGKDITDYDVRGELCVRGPLVIPGYYNNPVANARDFDADGYFHTGDVAYRDSKSRMWYIVDRKKELIKVRGFQVAPPELEAVLLQHPDIVDAAVIGVKFKQEDASEYPRAYVVRRPGAENLTAADVKKYIVDRLIYYKRLDGGVVFRDAIPKNPSGKILKRLLREDATKELAQEGGRENAKL